MRVFKSDVKIWYLLLFSLILFPLKLSGNVRYVTYVFIYFIPLLVLILNYKRLYIAYRGIRCRRVQLFVMITLYLLIISAIIPVAFGTFDFSYVTSYWTDGFLWLIKFVFLVLVFEIFIDSSCDIKLFIDYFVKAVSLYVIFSVMALFISPLRESLLSVLYFTDIDLQNLSRPEYWTRFGWSGWSGFNETAICTSAVVFNGLLLLNSQTAKEERKYVLQSLLPMVGNALYGRIGLLASVVFLGLSILYSLATGNIRIVIRVFLALAVVILVLYRLRDQFSFINDWYNWVFSAFANYKETGMLYDNVGTIQHLTTDMYWLPDWDTLLFGDGRYFEEDGSYYLGTDAGIMRAILYFGIFNYLLSLIAVFLLIIDFVYRLWGYTNKHYLIFAFMMMFVIGVYEFKGESLWMFAPILFSARLLLRQNKIPKEVSF